MYYYINITGTVNTKMKIIYNNPHVIPNQYDCLSVWSPKDFKRDGCLTKTNNAP